MKEPVGQDSSRDCMRRAEVNIKIDLKKTKTLASIALNEPVCVCECEIYKIK